MALYLKPIKKSAWFLISVYVKAPRALAIYSKFIPKQYEKSFYSYYFLISANGVWFTCAHPALFVNYYFKMIDQLE